MNLLFDFIADKAANTIHITREFDADLDLVWDAFTKAEILDQWTAPKPYRVQTKEMDFRVGGRWLYCMISPENVIVLSRYSLAEYIEINPKYDFTSRNTFSNENGDYITDTFSITKNSFQAGTDRTTVHIEKKFDNLATLEMMATGGFKEGMAAGMSNLDEYFRSLVPSK